MDKASLHREWSDQWTWFMVWAVVAVAPLVRIGCVSLFYFLMSRCSFSLSP